MLFCGLYIRIDKFFKIKFIYKLKLPFKYFTSVKIPSHKIKPVASKVNFSFWNNNNIICFLIIM